MDTSKVIETIDAVLKSLKGLEVALDHDDRQIVDTELWNARHKLNELRKHLESQTS